MASLGLDPGRIARNCAAALLVLVTLVGTLALTALPFGWVVVVAKLGQAVSLPAILGVSLVLFGLPASMVAGMRLVLRVNHLYERLRDCEPSGRTVPVWRRSVGERRRSGQRRMLDVVMVTVVGAAVTAVFVWFVVYGAPAVAL